VIESEGAPSLTKHYAIDKGAVLTGLESTTEGVPMDRPGETFQGSEKARKIELWAGKGKSEAKRVAKREEKMIIEGGT